MSYTFLDSSLTTIGTLTNRGGQQNNFWGDQINHSIATSNDVLTSVSLSVDQGNTDIDTSGNQKEWNHTIQGLSFNIDGMGRDINELDYVAYQDGVEGKTYLMTITQVSESTMGSGVHTKTVQGLNSAAYELSRKILRPQVFKIVPNSFEQRGSAQNILSYIFNEINWDLRIIGNFSDVDYTITEGTTAQSALQDIIKLFDAEIDAYVLMNNVGRGSNVMTKAGSIKRVFEFRDEIGNDNGDSVRLNRNMVSLTKTGARDSLYTKLYVMGADGITIGAVNGGADYLVDNAANHKYNLMGASEQPAQYLEGVVSNSALSNPQALIEWGRKQLTALNHPRYNYTVSSVDGKNVHLGDTVAVQDLEASEPIMLRSRIIAKTISFSNPQTDSFVLGEFSPIVVRPNSTTNKLIELQGKVVQMEFKVDRKSTNYYGPTEPKDPQNGDVWFWEKDGKQGMKRWENGQWVDVTDSHMSEMIDANLTVAQQYVDELNQKQKDAFDTFKTETNKTLADAKIERNAISTKSDTQFQSARNRADKISGDVAEVKKTADTLTARIDDPNTGMKAVLDLSNQGITMATSTDNKVSALTQNVDGLQSRVTKTEKGVTANETKITQTQSQVTTEVANRKTGDENVLTQTKDLLSSEITSVTRGYKSAIQQSADGLHATVSAVNQIVDSSLVNRLDNVYNGRSWSGAQSTSAWYYTNQSLYKGISSIGINTKNTTGGPYNHIGLEDINVSRMSGRTAYVSVDLLVQSMGGTDTDYFVIYLTQMDADKKRLTNVANLSITGTLGGTGNIGVGKGWTNYRAAPAIDPNTKYLRLTYQMRGNGNVYVSRPYIGSVELPTGGYVAGPVTNNQTTLQLFNDNFALGIKNNTGDIISGINGDSSGLSITGKKIVLDGKVTVTEDFYAKGGNFNNLNANNITGGTLNASRIKIKNPINNTEISLENGLVISQGNKAVMSVSEDALVVNNKNGVMVGGITAASPFKNDGILRIGHNPLVDPKVEKYPAIELGNLFDGNPYARFRSDLTVLNTNVRFNALFDIEGSTSKLKVGWVKGVPTNSKQQCPSLILYDSKGVMKCALVMSNVGTMYAYDHTKKTYKQLN